MLLYYFYTTTTTDCCMKEEKTTALLTSITSHRGGVFIILHRSKSVNHQSLPQITYQSLCFMHVFRNNRTNRLSAARSYYCSSVVG